MAGHPADDDVAPAKLAGVLRDGHLHAADALDKGLQERGGGFGLGVAMGTDNAALGLTAFDENKLRAEERAAEKTDEEEKYAFHSVVSF